MLMLSDKPIGIVLGHSYLSPYGARVNGLWSEYVYNRELVMWIQYAALAMGWNHYVIVDEAGSPAPLGTINAQHEELARIGCLAGLEIHFNAWSNPKHNYLSIFYREGDSMGNKLAVALSRELGPGLKANTGGQPAQVIGLPSPGWTNMRAVLYSPSPLVLIEPGFLTNPKFQEWILEPTSMEWLGVQICLVLKQFHEEHVS